MMRGLATRHASLDAGVASSSMAGRGAAGCSHHLPAPRKLRGCACFCAGSDGGGDGGKRVIEDRDLIIEIEYLQSYRANVGVCLVKQSNPELVFAARRVDDDSGAWQMPQGGIDAGEDARAACLRELEEETGIAPKHVEVIAESSDWLAYDFPTSIKQRMADTFVTRVKGRGAGSGGSSGGNAKPRRKKNFRKKVFKGQRQKWFLCKFTGDDGDIDLAARGEEHIEFSEWRWMPLSELPSQIVHFKQDVYAQVHDQFAPRIKDL